MISEGCDVVEYDDISRNAPVLKNVHVHIHTLFDERRFGLDETHSINDPEYLGGFEATVRSIEAGPARTARTSFEHRPRVDINNVNLRDNHFPNPFLSDPIDEFQQEPVLHTVRYMEHSAKEAGRPRDLKIQLCSILNRNLDVFRVGLSFSPAADLPPWIIDIILTARPF